MTLSRLAVLIWAICLLGCSAPRSGDLSAEPSGDDRAMRIVSLDYCADQYVLKFADREAIRALSPDAEKVFSYMRDAAAGLPKVRSSAEDVLLLQPDLIVRSYGGGPNAAAFFEKAGVPVLQVGFASSIDQIKQVIRDMSAGLGNAAAGDATVAQMERRLAAIPQREDAPEVLYMTPFGVTSGAGTQVAEVLELAGLANFQTEPGWRALPLERLAYEQPDLVAAAFFERMNTHSDSWSAMRHPVARRQVENLPTVALPSAWTSCGSWFLLDAIEALAGFDQAGLPKSGNAP